MKFQCTYCGHKWLGRKKSMEDYEGIVRCTQCQKAQLLEKAANSFEKEE